MRRITEIIKEDALPTASVGHSQVYPNALAILKPGFTDLDKEFKDVVKANGWNILKTKKGRLTKEQAKELYKMHSDKDFYDSLCDYMSSGEILAYACQKDTKDPVKDMDKIKDDFRKKHGKDEMKNAMHSSDSKDNTKRELNIIFKDDIKEGFLDLPANIETTEDPVIYDNEQIIKDLKSLYAEEIFAFYQYFVVYEFLKGKERPSIANKFKEFAMDELNDHAEKLLKRLNELNADVTDILSIFELENHAQNKFIRPNDSLTTKIALLQNISAEEGAINHYKAIIGATEGTDPTTCQMLKEILADEEEHFAELNDFLTDITSEL